MYRWTLIDSSWKALHFMFLARIDRTKRWTANRRQTHPGSQRHLWGPSTSFVICGRTLRQIQLNPKEFRQNVKRGIEWYKRNWHYTKIEPWKVNKSDDVMAVWRGIKGIYWLFSQKKTILALRTLNHFDLPLAMNTIIHPETLYNEWP
jgi:hypothetical protein